MKIKQVLVTSSMLVMAMGWLPTMVMASENRVKEIKQELKAERKEIKEEMKTMKKEWEKRVVNGVIITKGTDTFTISREDKTYTIKTSTDTMFLRKFGGKSSFAELTVGDSVKVRGTLDDAKTTIQANYVRDISIQKRWGSFEGMVSSVDATNNKLVVTTKNRGDLTLTLDASTKLIDRVGKNITLSQVLKDHKVVFSGVWNSTDKSIKQLTRLRDMSVPVKD